MDLGLIVERDGSHEYTSVSQGQDWASSPVCLIKKVQWLAIRKDFSGQIGSDRKVRSMGVSFPRRFGPFRSRLSGLIWLAW